MGGEERSVILDLNLRITRGNVAADCDEFAGEVGRLLLLALKMQVHLFTVAGKKLRQAEFRLMAQTLRGGLHLRLLEFDMADEFSGVILGIEGRAIAPQGLLIEHADHATRRDD